MKRELLSIRIDALKRSEVRTTIEGYLQSGERGYIVTPNPEMILTTRKNHLFHYIVRHALLALPDGAGLLWASTFLSKKITHIPVLRELEIFVYLCTTLAALVVWPKATRRIIPERVTGTDVVWDIAELCARHHKSLFLLGGKAGAAHETAQKLTARFSNLQIAGINDDHCTPENESAIRSQIDQCHADVVLVAYGAPKQEEWIFRNQPLLKHMQLAMGVGGAFDFIGGKMKRAPRGMRSLSLEWLWRLGKEPRRVSRIMNATVTFISTCVRYLWGVAPTFRENSVAVIFHPFPSQVLLVARRDAPEHWQFVQGGIEKGESAEDAVLRETEEELGISKSNFTVRKHLSLIHQYVWPLDVQLIHKKQGQRQHIFFLEYNSSQPFDLSKSEEFSRAKFVPTDHMEKEMHLFRRSLAHTIMQSL